jgi:alpha-L-arabinofuranosidase
MDVHDPERKVVLVVDEWGAWHKTDESKPGYMANVSGSIALKALVVSLS